MLDVYYCDCNEEFAVKEGKEPKYCPFCGNIEIADTDKKNQKDWKQVAVQLIEIAEKVVKDKLD